VSSWLIPRLTAMQFGRALQAETRQKRKDDHAREKMILDNITGKVEESGGGSEESMGGDSFDVSITGDTYNYASKVEDTKVQSSPPLQPGSYQPDPTPGNSSKWPVAAAALAVGLGAWSVPAIFSAWKGEPPAAQEPASEYQPILLPGKPK